VTLDTVPVYMRGGHIVARRERARRSTAAMQADPLTLVSGHLTPCSACHTTAGCRADGTTQGLASTAGVITTRA